MNQVGSTRNGKCFVSTTNKAAERTFDKIADDLGLTKKQRRTLHEQMQKEGQPLDAGSIRAIAQGLFGQKQ